MSDTIAAGLWRVQNPIPAANSNGIMISIGQRLFQIGGTTGAQITGCSEIYSAPINVDGTVGTWAVTGTIPVLYNFSRATSVGDILVLHGWDTTGASKVYTARVDPSGNVEKMVLSTIPMTADKFPVLVTHADKAVYAVGGIQTATGIEVWCGTQVAKDGLKWTPVTSLPVVNQYSNAIVYGDHLYSIGGSATAIASGVVDSVYSARILPGGALEAWRLVGHLPVALWKAACVVYNDKVVVMGGQDAASAMLATMYVAKLEMGGEIGKFASDPAGILVAARIPCATLVGRRIYLGAGINAGGSRLDTVYSLDLV